MSNPYITHVLQGPYFYERKEGSDVGYDYFIDDEAIDEWLEHALKHVLPYTYVRLVLEVYK
jgi:hypothetical protein